MVEIEFDQEFMSGILKICNYNDEIECNLKGI